MRRTGFTPNRRDVLKTAIGSAITASPLAAYAAEAAKPNAAAIRAAVKKTDALTRSLLQSSGIPGLAVTIVQGDRQIFAAGYGVTKIGAAQDVDADTVFQLASVSKSLGATVVAHQVGTTKIRWDTKMREILPWFALSEPEATRLVTIGDLYAHRSGLPDHVGDNLEIIGYDRNEIMHKLRYVPLDGFRTKYDYTNFGLTSAAQAVAVASGTDWATLSDNAIYAPLGMARTSSRFADFIARPNHALGHAMRNGKFVHLQQRDPDPQSPAGGASSSVNDLAKWMSMVLGNGVFQGRRIVPAAALKPAMSQQFMTHPAGPNGPAGYYGFGFNVGVTDAGWPMVNHSGAFVLGAATFFMLVPALNLGIAVLTNAWPLGVAEAIGLSFFDDVQFGAPRRDWATFLAPLVGAITAPEGGLAGKTPPATPMPPRPLGAYAGSYANEYYGPLDVTVEGDGLALVAGPNHSKFSCQHWDGDDFVIHPYNESAAPGSAYKVSFSGTPVTTVTTDFFDEPGVNVFRRP